MLKNLIAIIYYFLWLFYSGLATAKKNHSFVVYVCSKNINQGCSVDFRWNEFITFKSHREHTFRQYELELPSGEISHKNCFRKEFTQTSLDDLLEVSAGDSCAYRYLKIYFLDKGHFFLGDFMAQDKSYPNAHFEQMRLTREVTLDLNKNSIFKSKISDLGIIRSL